MTNFIRDEHLHKNGDGTEAQITTVATCSGWLQVQQVLTVTWNKKLPTWYFKFNYKLTTSMT